MDSWRLNLVAGYWVPSYIYSEEGDFGYGSKDKIAFKAQTRIWGYNLKVNGKEDELTQLVVDSNVNDQSAAAQDASPLKPNTNGSSRRKTTWLTGWNAQDWSHPPVNSTRFCKPL